MLLLADAAGDAAARHPAELAVARTTPRELVLLHPADTRVPQGTGAWLEGRGILMHHHLRRGRQEDVARLARLLIGRGVGLVLSGGGARGFAHLGAIRALHEAGVPIDLVAGTSMGAIVGAGLAMDWGSAAFERNMRASFVDINPLGDYTFPLVALVAGRKVTGQLRERFGTVQIEDLWRPFICVSTNLTSGSAAFHDSGSLWRWLRASCAIPGVLPPWIHEGQVYVDGGVVNNLPIDVLRRLGRGPLVAVDIGSDWSVTAPGVDPEQGLIARFFSDRASRGPNILQILWGTGTVGGLVSRATLLGQVDLLLQPPLGDFDILAWHEFDRIVAAGYDHTRAALGGAPASLFHR
jgi:NTE family protein